MSPVNPYGISTEDRQRAAQDLLDHLLLEADTSQSKVRRGQKLQKPLSEWFSKHTGWTLRRDRGTLRLTKTPAMLTADLGADWVKDPLDYELLGWALWYGEKQEGRPWLVTGLTRAVEDQASVVIGPGHIDWNNQRHRYCLRRALNWLRDLGVLEERDGDVDAWASEGHGQVLYCFTPVARRLELPLLPELVDAFGDLGEDLGAITHWLRARVPAEIRLYRTLLLSPALYRSDDPEAFALLESDRARTRIHADLQGRFGWDLEVTPTYACLLRPSAPGRRQQYAFPYTNGNFHPVVLFLGKVRACLEADDPRFGRGSDDRIHFSRGTLQSVVHAVADAHHDRWGRVLGEKAAKDVVRIVEEDLRSWGLLRGPDGDGRYALLPLAGRWKGVYSEAAADAEGEGATS